MTKPSTFLT